MTITENEARTALNAVEQVQRRSFELKAYREGGSHLIWWGLIWIVGYVGMGTVPEAHWGQIWLVLNVLGASGSALLGMRAAKRGEKPSQTGLLWRWLGTWLLVGVFCVGLFQLVGLPGAAEALALPPMFVALAYGVIGVWILPRYIWIAAAMFGLSLVGYLVLREHLAFIIAVAGGGGMVMSGIWLRSA